MRPTASSATLEQLGISKLEAILLTHTHFDHIGAVAPVAKATGAPVYCPELETRVLADIMSYIPWEGFGPYESWDAEETVSGGEHLELAGFEIDVVFTPGHSPGHVTYSIPDERVLFSGDVLFQGSVGRTDLPFGDWPTLLASIGSLLERFPGRDRRLSRAHGSHHARRRARHEPVPSRTRDLLVAFSAQPGHHARAAMGHRCAHAALEALSMRGAHTQGNKPREQAGSQTMRPGHSCPTPPLWSL